MTLDTRIANTAARVFNLDAAGIRPDMKIGDVADWDSLGQLNLIVEIESVFGTRFTGEQLVSLNSLNEIQKELAGRDLLNG